MLKNQAEHEQGIKKKYIQNKNGKKGSFHRLIRLTRKGAHIGTTKHMDAKVRRCYPRGKAWLRIVDLHTSHWLHSK